MSKGITLISLVVTIIVLLILAGVSISLISGSNGILNRTSHAVDENNTINMYPCSENGDGKAIYWYGMEFTDLILSGVSYNDIIFTSSTDGVNKFDNNMLLRMNDNDCHESIRFK